MPRYIIKLLDTSDNNREYYLEWSTVTDEPITRGMSKEELRYYYQQEYGKHGLRQLDAGQVTILTAHNDRTYQLFLNHLNGPITIEQVLDKYCRSEPPPVETDKQQEDYLKVFNHGTDPIDLTEHLPVLEMRPIALHYRASGDIDDNPSFVIVMKVPSVSYTVFGQLSYKTLNRALARLGYTLFQP